MLYQLLFSNRLTNPLELLFNLSILTIALLVAITVHEFAHAWSAERLGDPTARLAGRMTLNPIPHLDPLGTIMLLIAGIGWGKPVPVDPFNFRHPRRDMAVTSFAGAAANLTLATILSLIIKISMFYRVVPELIINIVLQTIYLSVLLAIFNLLPIHPLDGSAVLTGLLPRDLAEDYDRFSHQYGLFILIFLIFPFFGAPLISRIIFPIINFILSLLLPGSTLV
jgi:Zn-dependent protease